MFDEPDVAAAKHRAGLRRLVALQIKEPLKYLEKNIPDLQRMARRVHAARHAGRAARSRSSRWRSTAPSSPIRCRTDAASFKTRIDEGRARLNLIAQEVARQAATVLTEFATAQRKLKDARPPKEVADDITAQLQRLVPQALPRRPRRGRSCSTCRAT